MRGNRSQSGSGKSSAADAKQKTSGLPTLLFDLDGTLIDSVYEHVAAWSRVLRKEGLVLPAWKIHRHIGMSGSSFIHELAREAGAKRPVDIERLERNHDRQFNKERLEILPGANELLKFLRRSGVGCAIATTGGRKQTDRLLRLLDLPKDIEVVTGDDVKRAKPAPDIFVLAAQRMGAAISDCIVIGDSTWDVLAAGRKSALGVGMLSGGYSQEELERAGAFRVYADPQDLLIHIEDLGIPGS